MYRALLNLLAFASFVFLAGTSQANMPQTTKENGQGKQQKEVIEKKAKPKKASSQSTQDKQKELANQQKQHEATSNAAKTRRESERTIMQNLR